MERYKGKENAALLNSTLEKRVGLMNPKQSENPFSPANDGEDTYDEFLSEANFKSANLKLSNNF